MEHLEEHPHAFFDENGTVKYIFLFADHDITLLNQVKESVGSFEYKSCCEYGIAYVDGDLYNGKFYPPQPFPNWIRDEVNLIWVKPDTISG